MPPTQPVDLAARLDNARTLADQLAAELKAAHDALWTGDPRAAAKIAGRAERLTRRVAAALAGHQTDMTTTDPGR